jgi:RNA polymerase sigma factor (sigma-70 family)
MEHAPATGDGQWIRDAVRRYEQRLMLYATHLLGDVERARDVVQETFLKLCTQDPHRIDPHLAEWLYTVCRNAALDVRRKEKRMRAMGEEMQHSQAGREADPSAGAEASDETARAMKFIDQLPPNQQECIRLKFQQALSYEQISRVTGLSVSNVGYLIHMGLKTVRQRMNESR